MIIKRLNINEANLAFDAISNIKLKDDITTRNNLSLEYLENFLSNERHYLFAAIENKQVVGFLLAYRLQRIDRDQDAMFFYEIEVDQSFRNMGVGSKLIKQLKEECRKENVMKMWVETNRSNLSAMELYRKTGGKENTYRDEVSFTYYPPFK
ncbi:MAG: GNAT family N-acetyltransferase [Bacillota bacterium]